MPKRKINYTFPTELVYALHNVSDSRSGAVEKAVDAAFKEPQSLLRALARRCERRVVVSPGLGKTPQMTPVTLSLDVTVPDKLNHLAELSGLPIEHVVRLALEDYLRWQMV